MLGFDYGYSLGYPDARVLWEAQFGDFANAAQVIIDQFIVAPKKSGGALAVSCFCCPTVSKDGAGTFHARVRAVLAAGHRRERASRRAEHARQFFHVLRRQAIRNWKKPLVVLTPKSLLRHAGMRLVVGKPDEADSARDHRSEFHRSQPSRVLLCSGKLYYELLKERNKGDPDVAIIRLKQYHRCRNRS